MGLVVYVRPRLSARLYLPGASRDPEHSFLFCRSMDDAQSSPCFLRSSSSPSFTFEEGKDSSATLRNGKPVESHTTVFAAWTMLMVSPCFLCTSSFSGYLDGAATTDVRL